MFCIYTGHVRNLKKGKRQVEFAACCPIALSVEQLALRPPLRSDRTRCGAFTLWMKTNCRLENKPTADEVKITISDNERRSAEPSRRDRMEEDRWGGRR